ncbi:hypothetical protein SETIT_8G052900v2, partial [Setaria italica]
METLTNPRAPSDPPAARPRWVMLDPNVNNKVDSKSFTVSFILAPPPATSSYHCDWIIGGAPGHGYNSNDDLRHRIVPDRDRSNDLLVIEAHDDSVLIKMSVPERRGCFLRDYFLYETGGAARPPSLSLLPGCYISKQFEREKGPTPNDRPRSLDNWNTGVLRRGGGELQVAQLEVMYGDPPHDTAGLCVVRPGAEWDLKRLPIVHQEAGELPQWPELDAAVPVGVRFMCWVDYVNGFFLCDMAEPGGDLPRQGTHGRNSGRRPYLPYCRNLAAAGCDAVRFVSVAPRCCCGGHSETSCERSRFAFNVTTWTLTLRTEGPMTWLPNYSSLPRVTPRYPIVSSDNPDTVCFVVSETYADKNVWLLEIDARSKTLLSAVLHNTSGYFSH